MEGGVITDTPPNNNTNTKTSEIYINIIDYLCKRFNGISPFEILNRTTSEVFDLYVDCVLQDNKDKKQDEWVTSKTATWH